MFRERIGARESLLLLVSVGLVLVVPSFDLLDQGTVGLLWGLASGLSFALLAITNRRAARGMDALQVAFWQNMTVALRVAPFALDNLVVHGLSHSDWVYLAMLGVFCTGLCRGTAPLQATGSRRSVDGTGVARVRWQASSHIRPCHPAQCPTPTTPWPHRPTHPQRTTSATRCGEPAHNRRQNRLPAACHWRP